MGRGGRNRGTIEDSVALLPTPAAGNFSDSETPESHQARSDGLLDAGSRPLGTPLGLAVRMLPTPMAADGGTGRGSSSGNGMRNVSKAIHREALLRTPTAQLAVNGGSQHPDKRRQGGHQPTLADEVEHLLPTPLATDGSKGSPNQRGSSGDLMQPSAVHQMLPTPNATDWKGGNTPEGRARNDGRTRTAADADLPEAVGALLPTPTVGESKGTRNSTALTDVLLPTPSAADGEGGHKTRSGKRLLAGVAEDILQADDGEDGGDLEAVIVQLADRLEPVAEALEQLTFDGVVQVVANVIGAPPPSQWGPYDAAIRRWEQIFGHPAPPATAPAGRNGAHRLNPAFAEWMMGIEPGWVTGLASSCQPHGSRPKPGCQVCREGLSRTEQLKIIGNGVVRSQAAIAWRELLPAVPDHVWVALYGSAGRDEAAS